MAADGTPGFFGGLIRASANKLATTLLNNVVDAYGSSEANPAAVLEVTGKNIEEVSHFGVNKRDKLGVVLLHENRVKQSTPPWLIILHQPLKMWYLYRSQNKMEAEAVFKMYTGIAPLVKADLTICDTSNLSKICTLLREPSSAGWTGAHIAAAFNYTKALNTEGMKEYLERQEGPLLKTPLHLALEFKNVDVVKTLLKLNVHLDMRDIKDNNVVHYGSQSSPQALKLILEKLPSRLSGLKDEWNSEGMTPLALACKFNLPQNVEILLGTGCNVQICTKNDGYPMTIALKNNCPLSMDSLLTHSADQINFTDDTDGSCALHWACAPEILHVLLDHGGDPNIRNKKGQTPLHIQVNRGSLKGCIALLCQGAFPDMKDLKGNTPLHDAASMCSQIIVQVLLCFEADPNLVNDLGQTPRHLVVTSQQGNKDQVLFILDSCGAVRCPASYRAGCTEGCSWTGGYKGTKPDKYIGVLDPTLVQDALEAFSTTRHILSRSRRSSGNIDGAGTTGGGRGGGGHVRSCLLDGYVGGRLLSLDGGGIRGLILAQMLLCMEKEFGVPVVELFDWVAGTSTGGILALCLASGKSPIEIQALYLRLKDKVFVGDRPYSTEGMEEFFKKELGAKTKMSDLQRPRLLITTAIATQRPAEFHFFRNYLSPAVIMGETDACDRPPEDLYVWEVAKATGAAPSYFKLDAKYIDGGLVANNPTLDAITELIQFSAVMRASGETTEVEASLPSVIVSLGTGVLPPVRSTFASYDISRPDGFFDAIVKVPKIANIIALLVEQATQTEGQIVERARAWAASIGVPYFRFSPHLSKVVDLDETNEETLVTIMWETRAYLYAHRHAIVHLKRLLFANGSPPPPPLPVPDNEPATDGDLVVF